MKASEDSFQLPPFPAFPCVSRYVPIGSVADAVERICRSIKSSDGVSLLVGPPGTGKSLICRMLADHFDSTHDVVVLGDAPIEDQPAFYRHLLHHLGVDLKEVSQGDLHLALIDTVSSKHAAENGLLIIVDEAQSLSPEVLEAIRMATNIMHDDQPRVTALVCGGVKLEDTLAAPAMEPFTQRVSTRCYLHPMNSAETRQYIRETIRGCEADPDETITDEALGAVHHACSGVPRLVNQIMTEAIDCAADNEQNHICERVIDQAWAQLQQLPSPMVEEPKIAHKIAPVEFGSLSSADAFENTNRSEPCASEEVCEQTADFGPLSELTPAIEQAAHEPDFHQSADLTTSMGADVFDEPVDSNAMPQVEWSEECQSQESLAIAPGSFRDVPAPRPLPTELFGEFEIEESVTVGTGVVSTPLGNQLPVQTPVAQTPAAQRPMDLESMIHSEIVNLSDVAAAARFGCGDAQVHEMAALEMDHQPAIWMDEPQPEIAKAMQQPLASKPQVELAKPIDLDAPPAHEDIVVCDDRKSDDTDMLVIEDEVDIAVQPSQTRIDDQQETVTVDFRAMLSNMRQSS